MTTVRAYVDSNLLLQFQPLTQIDWPSVLNASNVELVVAPIVIRELEEKKQGDNKRLRKRATAALELILKCIGNDLEGEVRKSVTLHVQPNEPSLDFGAAGLNKDVNDDWLVASLIEDAASAPIVISDDTGLLMKLRARRIAHVRPPAGARLPQEEDEETRKLSEENKALKQQLAKRPRLRFGFTNGTAVLRAKATTSGPIPDRELDATISARRKELLDSVAVRNNWRLHGGVRAPAGKLDEKELEGYLAKLRAYHHACHVHEDLTRRTTGAELRLFNEGSAPASGVEIHITFPDDVEVGEDMFPHEEPEEPPLPLFFQNGMLHSWFGSHSSAPNLQRRLQSAIDGTYLGAPGRRENRWLNEAQGRHDNRWHIDGNVLSTSLGELLHKLQFDFTQFWIAFPVRARRLSGFEARAVLLVASPADELEVTLGFVPSG